MQNREKHERRSRGVLLAGIGAALAGLLALLAPTAGWAVPRTPPRGTVEVIRPSADGTIADGGVFGDFDGIPDDWDWTFDGSGYDGSITLTTETPDNSLEQRVIWEYDLSGLSHEPPVRAMLTVTLRGAPVYPMEDAVVHIYAYPADLEETPDDFSSGPTVLVGTVTVAPFQEPTVYRLNVSKAVNDALFGGADAVALRFQINPDTPYDKNQAFIDADDELPETKPFLTIRAGLQHAPAARRLP